MLEMSVEPAIAALRDASYAVVSGPRTSAGHGAGDGAQARGDLPASGSRLLVRRPPARPDLGRDRGDDRGARGGRGRSDARADDRAGQRPAAAVQPWWASAGTRASRLPVRCTSPVPTSRRPWPRWVRSSRPSSSSKDWPAPSASTRTTHAVWTRSPPPIPGSEPTTKENDR